MKTPLPRLKAMRLPAAEVLPPMTVLRELLIKMPAPAFGRGVVPERSVPMKLPRICVPVTALPETRMPFWRPTSTERRWSGAAGFRSGSSEIDCQPDSRRPNGRVWIRPLALS